MTGKKNTLGKVREAIQEIPKLSKKVKAIATDQIIGDRPLRNARDYAVLVWDEHTTNKSHPKYNPGEVTADAACEVLKTIFHEEKKNLDSGPGTPKKRKATPEYIALWKRAARLLWAIDLRDNGFKRTGRKIAEQIANNPTLNPNKAKAAPGTIRNCIKGVKSTVKKPAAPGDEINDLY